MKWWNILKIARENKGLSLRQVEEKTNISNGYISQLENGLVKEPSFFKMLRLLSLYNVSVRDVGSELIVAEIRKLLEGEKGTCCPTCGRNR